MSNDYNRYTFVPAMDWHNNKYSDNNYVVLYYNPCYMVNEATGWRYFKSYQVKSLYNVHLHGIDDNVSKLFVFDSKDSDTYTAKEVLDICKAFKDQYGKDLAVITYSKREKEPNYVS